MLNKNIYNNNNIIIIIIQTTKEKGIFKPYNLETKYPEHQFSFGEESKSIVYI